MGSDRGSVAVRAEAARTLHAVVAEGRSLDDALSRAEANLPAKEHALFRMLCYGSIRYYWSLAARIDDLLSRPLKRRDRTIHALLVVGVFQLSKTRVAPHAAVSLTVEAARLLRRPNLKALVNGVLRNALRQTAWDDARVKEPERYDHPQWFIDRVRHDWPDHWEAVLGANNDRAPMWLRVNQAVSSVAAYRQELAEELGTDGEASSSVLEGIEQGCVLGEPAAGGQASRFRGGPRLGARCCRAARGPVVVGPHRWQHVP